MMYWFGNNINGWGYTVMIISMAVFWGLVITGFVMLNRSDGQRGKSTPELVLGQRFARGEIDTTEYHDRLAALHAGMRS